MKLKGRNKVSPEFSMSSMTDVVFLLLIFFMLTANTPNALDLLLPKARGKSTNTQNVSVTINRDLEYFVNNEQINKQYIEIDAVPRYETQEKILYTYNHPVKCTAPVAFLYWPDVYGTAHRKWDHG